jgi:hypothetical protein
MTSPRKVKRVCLKTVNRTKSCRRSAPVEHGGVIQLQERGTFGDASKKEHGVFVTRSGQGLAWLSPMSHLEPETSHRHEVAERERSQHRRQHCTMYCQPTAAW